MKYRLTPFHFLALYLLGNLFYWIYQGFEGKEIPDLGTEGFYLYLTMFVLLADLLLQVLFRRMESKDLLNFIELGISLYVVIKVW